MQALYASFQQLPVAASRFTEIKHTYDAVERILRQLTAQGERVEEQGLLVHHILSKFPIDVLTKLEESKALTSSWTVQSVREALLQYISVHENAQRHMTVTAGDTNLVDSSQTKGMMPTAVPSFRSSAEILTTTTTTRARTKTPVSSPTKRSPSSPCIFCGGLHFNEHCDCYSTMFQRKQRLRQLGRCFICLQSGHTFRDCPPQQRRPCAHCKQTGHHNRAICPKRPSEQRGARSVTAVTTASENYPSNPQPAIETPQAIRNPPLRLPHSSIRLRPKLSRVLKGYSFRQL